jgi:hypothetical protein
MSISGEFCSELKSPVTITGVSFSFRFLILSMIKIADEVARNSTEVARNRTFAA